MAGLLGFINKTVKAAKGDRKALDDTVDQTRPIIDALDAFTSFFGISETKEQNLYEKVRAAVQEEFAKNKGNLESFRQGLVSKLQSSPFMPADIKAKLNKLPTQLITNYEKATNKLNLADTMQGDKIRKEGRDKDKSLNNYGFGKTTKEYNALMRNKASQAIAKNANKTSQEHFKKTIKEIVRTNANNASYNTILAKQKLNKNNAKVSSDNNRIFSSPTTSQVARQGDQTINNNINSRSNYEK